MKRAVTLLLVCGLLGFCALGAFAEGGSELLAGLVGGGGGSSSGGAFSLQGSSGQTISGQTSGNEFSVDGGYWGAVAELAAPPGPDPVYLVHLPVVVRR